MLIQLQRELKRLIAKDRLETVLDRLIDQHLLESSPRYEDCILLSGRYKGMERDSLVHGTVAFKDSNREFNTVSRALLWIVDELEEKDLRKYKKTNVNYRAIPAYHALAVDRVPQKDKFTEDLIFSDPEQRVHFYYLYGDFKQAVESLVERLTFERDGYQFSMDHLDQTQQVRRPNIRVCQLETRGPERLVYFYLIRAIATHFLGPINDQRALLQKTLPDLLSSPSLKDLGAQDAVYILISINEDNWRRREINAALQKLFKEFCGSQLPADAPNFYFFFGVKYNKENQQLKADVAAAIAERSYGESLEELLPVNRDDLISWLERHQQLLPQGKTAPEYAADLYPDHDLLDMIEIKTRLQQLIDQHNEELLR
ncbi:MAG: hypothetical protein AAF433_14830 [Bacteroidota bacterium]